MKLSTPPAAASRDALVADEKVLILDFGAQYAQLIARRVRENHVYCEILKHDVTAQRVRELAPRGIILSGGPASVYDAGAPKCDPEILRLGIPVLGICYGLHLACEALGGKVDGAAKREFGRAKVHITSHADLFGDVLQRDSRSRRVGFLRAARFRAYRLAHGRLMACWLNRTSKSDFDLVG